MEVLTNKITDVVTSNIDTNKPIPEEVTGNETVVSETKDSTVTRVLVILNLPLYLILKPMSLLK